MCELLVAARTTAHADPLKALRGCFRRGMSATVKPDGHPWSGEERLPKFVIVKIPGVSVEAARKYSRLLYDTPDGQPGDEFSRVAQQRAWRLRWEDLPAAAQNKLQSTGELTIKAGAYAGAYDYTWAQTKAFFTHHLTGNETADLA